MNEQLVPEAGHAPRRLSPLTPVVRGPIVVLAVLGASWREVLDGGLSWASLWVLGLFAAGGLYGFASWFRTTYWVDRDELRIDTGVLSRQSRRMRIDRIQGIDVVQPFLARFFSLAELRFDMAGGDREGTLAFLPLREARALRSSLLERRDLVREDSAPSARLSEIPLGSGRPAASGAAAPERVLARLDLGLLLASLVASTETLVIVVVSVITAGAALVAGVPGVLGAMVPVLGGLALAQGRRLIAFHGFTVTDSRAGLHVRRGLFSLTSHSVALHRVQGVVVAEPWLWRPFGWARLEVSLAGYGREGGDDLAAASVLLPVAPRADVLALARHVLGGLDPEAVDLSRPPSRARWLAPLSLPWLGVGLGETLLVSRRGFFVRRLDAVPLARVQSLRLSQGPVQRRLRLASFHVDSPPGPVRVRAEHRDPADAAALHLRARLLAERSRSGAGGQPADGSAGPSIGSMPTPETTQ